MKLQNLNVRALLAATALAALLGACGGEETPTGPPEGPSEEVRGINGGGRWVVRGGVSRLGSVVVNGVRFDTSAASVTINGAPGNQADLRPGQVLRVVGDVDVGGATGQATQIEHEYSVRGSVQQISASAGTLTVLGQDVTVSLETILGDGFTASAGLETLLVGDAVIISGFHDSAGGLVASRLDRDGAAGSAGLLGRIAQLDSGAATFRIGGLLVNYGSASLDGFPGGVPANGQVVRAVGPQPAGSDTLVATALSWRAAGVVADAGENVGVEGLVTRYAGTGDFDVAGQQVVTNASTTYVGTSAAQVALDVFLDVQGARDPQGRVVAVRVEGIPRANIEIEARLDGVDAVAGTLQLLGIEALTTARTRYSDDDQPLSIGDLRVNDSVEIAGYMRDGRLVVARLEREDDGDDEVEIEGPATDLLAPEFRIAGIRILTTPDTEFDDSSAGQFFAVAAGRRVEVEGSWNGTVVLASEVELED